MHSSESGRSSLQFFPRQEGHIPLFGYVNQYSIGSSVPKLDLFHFDHPLVTKAETLYQLFAFEHNLISSFNTMSRPDIGLQSTTVNLYQDETIMTKYNCVYTTLQGFETLGGV